MFIANLQDQERLFQSCLLGSFKYLIALAMLGMSLFAQASDTIQVTDVDEMNLNTVSVDEDSGTAQFTVSESLTGISTTYSINLSSGVWSSWDSSGNAFSGQLPPDASTEWGVPCFTSPIAFGTCLGSTIIAGTYCEWRDHSFSARAASACPYGVQSLNTGICGFQASYTCLPDPDLGEYNTP